MNRKELNSSVIYGALMRTPSALGVPFDYLPFLLMASVLTFMFTRSPVLLFAVTLIFWLIGHLVHRFDPDGFGILIAYTQGYLREKSRNKVLRYLPW